jgi:hypothetical protein
MVLSPNPAVKRSVMMERDIVKRLRRPGIEDYETDMGVAGDAAREIVRLRELNARYSDLLRQIAYPAYGTEESDMDREDCVKLIECNFSLAELMANVQMSGG